MPSSGTRISRRSDTADMRLLQFSGEEFNDNFVESSGTLQIRHMAGTLEKDEWSVEYTLRRMRHVHMNSSVLLTPDEQGADTIGQCGKLITDHIVVDAVAKVFRKNFRGPVRAW